MANQISLGGNAHSVALSLNFEPFAPTAQSDAPLDHAHRAAVHRLYWPPVCDAAVYRIEGAPACPIRQPRAAVTFALPPAQRDNVVVALKFDYTEDDVGWRERDAGAACALILTCLGVEVRPLPCCAAIVSTIAPRRRPHPARERALLSDGPCRPRRPSPSSAASLSSRRA